MDNPFKKRATEFIDDPAVLLSLVSPEPLRIFFENDATALFDRLSLVVGTPGSGKTTLARLLELDTIVALCRSVQRDSKQLVAALSECGVLRDLQPRFLGHRLPCGSNLRDIWELPYGQGVRAGLLRSLIQARAVLGWMRKLERVGVDLRSVEVVTRDGLEAQRRLIRADDPIAFREFARDVEERILRVVTSLVAPSEVQLAELTANSRYEAFEAVASITVPSMSGMAGEPISLIPLVMLDDAHELHPTQFEYVDQWLRSREMKVARWIMTRVDAIGHDEFRKAISVSEASQTGGTTPGRDRTLKLMQRDRKDRQTFRRIARDISRRYIEQMLVFSRKGVRTLEDCLLVEPQQITASQLKQLQESIDQVQSDARFSPSQIIALKASLPQKALEDEQAAIFRILLHREKRRTPQVDLFGSDSEIEEPENGPRNVSAALITGAQIQLMHQFDRPFFYSFDRLSDGSNDNIEQFISLAGALVDEIETRMVRGRSPTLEARQQHNALIRRARETIAAWDFPHCDAVRALISFIGNKCIDRTMEPNAPLDDGANAFGIPQSEMDRLKESAPELVPVLHFALAYNALSLVENYECKRRTWCLFELGGLPIIANKLTFSRGGFCEGHLDDLAARVLK